MEKKKELLKALPKVDECLMWLSEILEPDVPLRIVKECVQETIDGERKKILSGKTDLKSYWTIPEGVKILHHKVIPIEVFVENDTAYDYGYYEEEN